eukprot:1401481-Pleurochrysis_carterae.AAC.1
MPYCCERSEATATELLVPALMVTRRFDVSALAKWCDRVLIQESRCREMGVLWASPGVKDVGGVEWHGKGSLLSDDCGMGGALAFVSDALRAVARVLHEWQSSEGAAQSVLPAKVEERRTRSPRALFKKDDRPAALGGRGGLRGPGATDARGQLTAKGKIYPLIWDTPG